MTSRDFCYWLQGYFELMNKVHEENLALTREQTDCIAKHLSMVFVHEIDPTFGKDNEKLNQIHNNTIEPTPVKTTKAHPYSDPNPHHRIYRC